MGKYRRFGRIAPTYRKSRLVRTAMAVGHEAPPGGPLAMTFADADEASRSTIAEVGVRC